MYKKIRILFGVLAMALQLGCLTVQAEELEPRLELSTGGGSKSLTDNLYATVKTFSKGDTITIYAADETLISGLYIIWNSPVESSWMLTTDGGTKMYGQNGFLHEYISLTEKTSKAVIHIQAESASICDIRIFDDGELPKDVQVWNLPCERADIMVIPSHSDDEILFFGGVLPTYGVVRDAVIQVVYMTEFWSSWPVREHEKLDGLWESGITYYPVCLDFQDIYVENMDAAEKAYD